jgi:segregation and condensation protein B
LNGEEHLPSTDVETPSETSELLEIPESPRGEDRPEAVAVLSLPDVQASVEALLYASGEPLSVKDLKKALPEAGDRIRPALDQLTELYGREGRGLQLVEVAGGFQITTRPEFHEVVSRLLSSPKPARLSLQALETLAVIAYRQPITVPELMDLRGVRSASVVRTLLEKKLVRIVGRKPVVGRPLMYGTTKEFLLRFGLKDLRDLPQLKDMSEVFGDEVALQLEPSEEPVEPGAMEEAGDAAAAEEPPPGEPVEEDVAAADASEP